MSTFGKLLHATVDLALLSGFLAGVKKSTGLEPKISLINQPEVEKYATMYLDFGDSIFTRSTQFMGASEYFTRK